MPPMTYTKRKKLQTGTGGDVWGEPIPQEIPIKTLSDGTKINTMTGRVTSPSGEVSVLQDARLQAQYPDVGIIQKGGRVIGREISQESLNLLKLMAQTPTQQTQEQIAAINAQKAAGLPIGESIIESLGQGVSTGAKGAAIGAIGGAAGGTVILPGIGTIAGAGGGAILGGATGFITGFFGSLYGNLKNNAQKDIVADYASYQDSLMNIKSIIANAGRDPMDALQLYQVELAKIDAAERKLKMSSEKEWLSTSKKQLVKIQDFNSYQREQTRQMLLTAIMNPNVIQNFDVPQDISAEVTQ